MRTRALTCLSAVLICAPALAAAQSSSMFSNLANPAIGLNGLFSGQAAPNLNQASGLHFDEAELSFLSVVDPYWTFAGNIVFVGDGTVDPEEVWARSVNIPSIQLKLGKLRGTFGRHGLLHTHAFPFIQAPIIMENSIGGEGFKDTGIEAAWLTPLPWYAEEKAASGAFASLLGLEIFKKANGGPSPYAWRAVAVGDSCLFQVEAGQVSKAWPIGNSAEFGR